MRRRRIPRTVPREYCEVNGTIYVLNDGQWSSAEVQEEQQEQKEKMKIVSLRPNQLIRGQEFGGNRYIYLDMAVPDVFEWLIDEIDEPIVN